jgi:hypothetical protein
MNAAASKKIWQAEKCPERRKQQVDAWLEQFRFKSPTSCRMPSQSSPMDVYTASCINGRYSCQCNWARRLQGSGWLCNVCGPKNKSLKHDREGRHFCSHILELKLEFGV